MFRVFKFRKLWGLYVKVMGCGESDVCCVSLGYFKLFSRNNVLLIVVVCNWS